MLKSITRPFQNGSASSSCSKPKCVEIHDRFRWVDVRKSYRHLPSWSRQVIAPATIGINASELDNAIKGSGTIWRRTSVETHRAKIDWFTWVTVTIRKGSEDHTVSTPPENSTQRSAWSSVSSLFEQIFMSRSMRGCFLRPDVQLLHPARRANRRLHVMSKVLYISTTGLGNHSLMVAVS